VRFKPNRQAAKQLLGDEPMRRAMEQIARQGADNVEARAPRIVKHRGSRIYGEAKSDSGEWIAYIAVRSPFWHFPEYGHSRYAPRPFLRPGVQEVLSRHGGRFKSQ
jgi:hypothetical protein